MKTPMNTKMSRVEYYRFCDQIECICDRADEFTVGDGSYLSMRLHLLTAVVEEYDRLEWLTVFRKRPGTYRKRYASTRLVGCRIPIVPYI